MVLSSRVVKLAAAALVLVAAGAAAGCSGPSNPALDAGVLPQTLFVAYGGDVPAPGVITSFDLSRCDPSGCPQRAGAVQDMEEPRGLTALADGRLVLDVGYSADHALDRVVAIDAPKMIRTSFAGFNAGGSMAQQTNGQLGPLSGGRQLWFAWAAGLVHLIDADEPLATRGTVMLGEGDHTFAPSAMLPRAVATSDLDCANVISVVDYGDPMNPSIVGTPADAPAVGLATGCAPGNMANVPGAVGCATAANGKAYCPMALQGDVLAVTTDTATPAFAVITTTAKGGRVLDPPTGTKPFGRESFTFDPTGRYLFIAAPQPHTAAPGQIGTLVVLDTSTDSQIASLPLTSAAPDVTGFVPGAMTLGPDGTTIFLAVDGLATVAATEELVVDVTDPAAPLESPAITVAPSIIVSGLAPRVIVRDQVMSGDGKWLFVTSATANKVTQIDVAMKRPVRDLIVADVPKQVATFGSAEGPGRR